MKLRVVLFWLIIAAYATNSSSTPDDIGIAEVAIAFFLIGMIGPSAAIYSLIPMIGQTKFIRLSKFVLLFFITVPLVVAFTLRNNSTGDVVRDFVPMLYFFIYVFMDTIIRKNQRKWLIRLSLGLVIIGSFYSIRFFMIENTSVLDIGRRVQFGDQRYLPMDPAVTFASIFCFVQSITLVEKKQIKLAIFLLIGGVICFASLSAMMVRAPILLTILAILVRVLLMRRRTATGLFLKATLVVIAGYGIIIALPVLSLVATKFQEVGLNTKDLEAAALADWSSSSIVNFVFGSGWGGLFDSPAYNSDVRYVHNLPGYLLLKTGILGFVFGLAVVYRSYLVPLLILTRQTMRGNLNKLEISVCIASVGTFSSALFLQPTFKSLSFGLILSAVLIASSGMERSKLRRPRSPIRPSPVLF